jgi:hypothetical protein
VPLGRPVVPEVNAISATSSLECRKKEGH